MHIGYPVEDPATPRRIRVPAISGTHQIVDTRSNRLLRVGKRRHVIQARPQSILWMIGHDANVIVACFSRNTRVVYLFPGKA